MRRFFSPPELGDAELNEQARMFHNIARATLIIITLVVPVITWIQPDAFVRGMVLTIILDLLALATLAINRRGGTRLASWLFVGTIVAVLTVNAFGVGGIRSPGIQAFFVIVMLAGLLLGDRAGFIMAIVCAALALLLVIVEEAGFDVTDLRYSGPSLWLLNCLYIAVAMFTMQLARRAVLRALRRAEAELVERRAAQQRLDQALDAGEIGVFDHTLHDDRLRLDARAQELLALTPDPRGTVDLAEWAHRVVPADLERVGRIIREFSTGRSQAHFGYRYRMPNGTERHIDAAAYVTRDDRGAPSVVVGMLTDVSERLRIETERERLVRDLGERVKELRLLHDAAALLREQRGFDRDVLDQLVARIPPAWLYPQDCRARITFLEIDARSPDWRETPWQLSATFETSVGAGTISVGYVRELPTEDEGPFLAEERELIDSLAKLLRSHIEEHAAEIRRRALEAQLRQAQKMEALGTLAGGIAHDFNNILTAIGSNTELAAELAPADGALRRHVGEIATAHARARDLVRRILLFSRQQDSERRLIDVGPVVDEALQLIRASVAPNITIRTTATGTLPAISADPTQLHQVVMNLGTNAAYAMRGAGGTLAVDVSSVVVGDDERSPSADLRPGEHVCITVRDTGTGMSPEVQSRLFEPFFTTKGAAGTGLGLSVVHGIVRDHGGAIVVESVPAAGTTFRVYLPAAGEAPSGGHSRRGLVRGAGQHVLYLDDEEAIAWVMTRALERVGYRCTSFSDPHAALQEFRTTPQAFDAVISDMQMPGMTGLEFARAVHAVRADVPFAIATGFAPEDAERAPPPGVGAWIHKPATLEELSRTLHAMLNP